MAAGFRAPNGPWRERWVTTGDPVQSIAQDAFFAAQQNISANAIPSAEAFGAMTVDQSFNVLAIASGEAFSVLVIDQSKSIGSIGSGEAFGPFHFDQTITGLGGIGQPISQFPSGFPVLEFRLTGLGIFPSGEIFGPFSIGDQIVLQSIDPPGGIGQPAQFGPLVVDQDTANSLNAIPAGGIFGPVDLLCQINVPSLASSEAFDLPAVQMFIGGGAGQPPLGGWADEEFGPVILDAEVIDHGPQRVGQLLPLDNTDPYGIDLEMTTMGDLALRGRGDLSRLGGAPNCAQALVLRLRAYPGELPLHEDYGSQLVSQLIGRKQLDVGLARAIANLEARGIIEHDRRFLAIINVTAVDGGPRTLLVGLTLRLAGGELVALDDLAETRIDEVTIDTTTVLDTDLDLAALDAGAIDYDRDDLGDQPDVDLLTGIAT